MKNERQGSTNVELSLFSSLDIADTGVGNGNTVISGEEAAGEQGQFDVPSASTTLPSRPQMRRGISQPPPLQPAPAAPAASQGLQIEPATDSLTLAQLRRLTVDMPRPEVRAYDFTYDDAASFPEELEEWFSYLEDEQAALINIRLAFQKRWDAFHKTNAPDGAGWIESSVDQRRRFVSHELLSVTTAEAQDRASALRSLTYIGLGVWGEIYGAKSAEAEAVASENGSPEESKSTKFYGAEVDGHLESIYECISIILECNGLEVLYNILQRTSPCKDPKSADMSENDVEAQAQDTDDNSKAEHIQEANNLMTLIYLFLETGRRQIKLGRGGSIRNALAALQPNLVEFLVKMIAMLRWEDSASLPPPKVLLLLWKSILLLLGGSPELEQLKAATREDTGRTVDDDKKTLITASPLDYHLFRQEITSKYPAYNPRPPILPLDSDNASILPPLQNSTGKGTRFRSGMGPANIQGNSGSILHQPVHIATPVPSPPPSPGGPGGKAGKKQNYQTNQNFPFLYPPLDLSEGSASPVREILGSKLQWPGTDVPASIVEAGELFAGRVRMSRALRQLWDERERFMRFERGWTGLDEGIDDAEGGISQEDAKRLDASAKERLRNVEQFYRNSLPHLQSLVIVLMRVVLANVTAIVTQQGQPNGIGGASAASGPEPGAAEAQPPQGGPRELAGRPAEGSVNSEDADTADKALAMTVEELNGVRAREITAKAVSGMLLLLLKWFKISHVLKFEFLAQLLLDSNYLPLILKLFAHQDIAKAIDTRIDRKELGFFGRCQKIARQAASTGGIEEEHGADEAAAQQQKRIQPLSPALARPPHSSSSAASTAGSEDGKDALGKPTATAADASTASTTNPATSNNDSLPAAATAQSVDELGCPIPTEPITIFSWRNFFASITFLRVMQKLCKRKAHRNLLLVQYKSAAILKKALRVPQRELRLYTLKLCKGQVPYCGRKWRQTNMRVITAVYLHCRPELRDDWLLAGSDVDADVEEALPLEQALRALTHWHNLQRYPAQMGVADRRLLEHEQDFFVRELDRMSLIVPADDGLDTGGNFANGGSSAAAGATTATNASIATTPAGSTAATPPPPQSQHPDGSNRYYYQAPQFMANNNMVNGTETHASVGGGGGGGNYNIIANNNSGANSSNWPPSSSSANRWGLTPQQILERWGDK